MINERNFFILEIPSSSSNSFVDGSLNTADSKLYWFLHFFKLIRLKIYFLDENDSGYSGFSGYIFSYIFGVFNKKKLKSQ